jgi:hypothetical protein
LLLNNNILNYTHYINCLLGVVFKQSSAAVATTAAAAFLASFLVL